MKKEGSSRKLNLVLNLIFILNFFVVLSQKQISYQGFDSSSEDNWNYNSTLNSGSIGVNSSTYFSSPNSLRLGGSSSSTPDDPYISFDNLNISNYTNVILNLYFSSNGTPDDNDDLFLDISYDNGVSYATSIKLIDGKTSTTSDVYAFNHTASSGNTVG